MKNTILLIAVLFVMNGTFVSCNFEYKVKQNMEEKPNITLTNIA